MIKFLGLGRKKKPEEVPRLGKGFIPTDRVNELSGKGFSEPEIIDVLRKEGFSAEEIDRALTQALKVGVTGKPEATEKLPTLQELQGKPPEPFAPAAKPEAVQMPEPSMQYPGYSPEEIAESVVEERMVEMDERLNEFRAKYANLEGRIANLHNQLQMMSKGRSQTEDVILNKMDSFKDSMSDIDARLSGLEKAFKEALPALIESVRSLTDLVQKFKTEK